MAVAELVAAGRNPAAAATTAAARERAADASSEDSESEDEDKLHVVPAASDAEGDEEGDVGEDEEVNVGEDEEGSVGEDEGVSVAPKTVATELGRAHRETLLDHARHVFGEKVVPKDSSQLRHVIDNLKTCIETVVTEKKMTSAQFVQMLASLVKTPAGGQKIAQKMKTFMQTVFERAVQLCGSVKPVRLELCGDEFANLASENNSPICRALSDINFETATDDTWNKWLRATCSLGMSQDFLMRKLFINAASVDERRLAVARGILLSSPALFDAALEGPELTEAATEELTDIPPTKSFMTAMLAATAQFSPALTPTKRTKSSPAYSNMVVRWIELAASQDDAVRLLLRRVFDAKKNNATFEALKADRDLDNATDKQRVVDALNTGVIRMGEGMVIQWNPTNRFKNPRTPSELDVLDPSQPLEPPYILTEKLWKDLRNDLALDLRILVKDTTWLHQEDSPASYIKQNKNLRMPALVLEYDCKVMDEDKHSMEWLVDGGSSAAILRGSSDPPVPDGTRRKRSRQLRPDDSDHDGERLRRGRAVPLRGVLGRLFRAREGQDGAVPVAGGGAVPRSARWRGTHGRRAGRAAGVRRAEQQAAYRGRDRGRVSLRRVGGKASVSVQLLLAARQALAWRACGAFPTLRFLAWCVSDPVRDSCLFAPFAQLRGRQRGLDAENVPD